MAARVQSTGKFRTSSGLSASGSFGSLPAIGALVIVGVQGAGLANWAAGDVTDNQGNTYSRAVLIESNRDAAIFFTVVTTSSGTFTVTVNPANLGTTVMAASAVEYSGTYAAGTGALDQTQSNSAGSGTAISTGTTSTLATAGGEIVAAIFSTSANQTSIDVETVSPAWTEEHEELSNSFTSGEFDTRIITGSSGTSCSWTASTSGGWGAAIATFREATSPSAGSAAGTSTVLGIAEATSEGAGSSDGSSTVAASSSTVGESVGEAAGLATVLGVSDADPGASATSVQPIFRCVGSLGAVSPIGTTVDGRIDGFLGFNGFTRAPWPCDGAFRYLVIRLSDPPGIGSSRIFTLEINGASTAMTVTFGPTDTRQRYVTGPIAVSVGDNVRLVVTHTGSPATADAYWSMEFVADTAAESGYATNLGGRSNGFFNPITAEWNPVLNAVEYYMPTDGTFTGMVANDTFDAVASGTHLLHYLYKNGVKQDGAGGTVDTELDLTGTAANVCVTNSFSLSVVRGDRIAVGLERTGTAFSGWNGFGIAFVASVDGVSLGGAGGVGTPDLTETQFLRPLEQTSPGWGEDEFDRRVMCGVSSFSIRDFYAVVDNEPGIGRGRGLAIRINNLDSAVGGTLKDLETLIDDAEGVDISDGSTFTVSHIPISSPDVTGDEWISWIYAAAGVVITERFPPDPGGEVPSGEPPTSADVPTGVMRRFFTLTKQDGTILGAADTDFFHDPVEWFGGYKPAELLSVSTIEREMPRDGTFRGVEVRVLLADTKRRWRRLAEQEAIATAYAAVYIVSDTVRYALGEPYRRIAGPVVRHRALDNLQYEIVVRDLLSERVAYLDQAPLVPNKVLAESEFPGLYDRTEGKAAPILIGHVTDESVAPRQGVVPPLLVAALNFQYFGGINQSVIACLWSMGAVADNGIWEIFYNPPTQPQFRNLVSLTAPNVWTPGRANWFETGLTEDYVEYPLPVGPNTRRYTPVFFDATDPLAEPFLNGAVVVAANIFGLTENADGSGLYLSDPSRVWAWLIINQLLVPYTTGEYAAMPTLDGVYEAIDSDSVERTRTRQHLRRTVIDGDALSGYPVGFMLGRDGQRQTLRHVLQELCLGTDMQQGINRHGQLIIDTEDASATPVLRLSDLLDLTDGDFSVDVDRDWFFNRMERYHGYRYVPPTAPNPAPAEGEPVPTPITEYNPWLSGPVIDVHQDAIDSNRGLVKTYKLENYVVRDDSVAQAVATVLLDRAVGPAPAYDGPRVFRIAGPTHKFLSLELGDNILIDHVDGYGDGYVGKAGRVMKISEDTDTWKTSIEGYLLTAEGGSVMGSGAVSVPVGSVGSSGSTVTHEIAVGTGTTAIPSGAVITTGNYVGIAFILPNPGELSLVGRAPTVSVSP